MQSANLSQPDSTSSAATRTVIVNPASASGRTAERWPGIVAALEAAGLKCSVVLTTAAGDATTVARNAVAAGARELVVLGGDGTVNEVVAGLVSDDGSAVIAPGVTVSIVHQGTGGDLARGIGVGHEDARAIDIVAHGDVRAVDLGIATYRDYEGQQQTRAFINCANVGMASEVVAGVVGKLKKLGDKGAFAISTIRSLLRNEQRSISLQSEDPPLDLRRDIVDVIASNNRYMGGGMLVAPDAQLDDGMLDLVVIAAASRTRLLRTFPKIYKGTHISDPLVSVHRTADVRLDATNGSPLGVVLDGEMVGTTPVHFQVLPAAINLRFPSSATA